MLRDWLAPVGVAAAVALRHYAYYAWPETRAIELPAACKSAVIEEDARQWAQYVLTGPAVAMLLLALLPAMLRRPGWPAWLGTWAVLWGLIEEAQVTVCGLHEWGAYGVGDLCLRSWSATAYSAAAAAAAAALAWGIARRLHRV